MVLLQLKAVHLLISLGRVKWFAYTKCKDNTDWIKRCTMIEVEGIIQRRH